MQIIFVRFLKHLHWNQQTVRNTIHRWQQGGLMSLWDAPRSGRKPSWKSEDIEYLQEHLDKDQRAYNSQQLSELLYRERKVSLSADWISRILKKKLLLETDSSQQPREARRRKSRESNPSAEHFRRNGKRRANPLTVFG
jgi:transposase